MKKKIFFGCFIAFIIFFIPFVILKIGFTINLVQTKFFDLEQLYIKLDKKLVVKAKKISILTKEDLNTSSENVDILEIVQSLKYLNAFFDEIDVKNIHYDGQDFKLNFKGDEYSLTNEHFFLKLNLQSENEKIYASITELSNKDLNASINGFISIDTKRDEYNFIGDLKSSSTAVNFNLTYAKDKFTYTFDDLNISNFNLLVTNLNKKIQIPKSIDEWLNKITAENIYFNYVKGSVKIDKNGYNFEDLDALGHATNLQFKLSENINAIIFPNLDLNLSKQELTFDFQKASFTGKDISKSKFYIYDVLDEKKSGIFIHIVSDELLFDKHVHAILKHYDIDIPIIQLSGKLKTDFKINIPFLLKNKASFKATFDLEDSKTTLADFWVKKGKVVLDDNNLSLNSFSVSNNFLEADFNANINLDQKKGVFNTKVYKLYFEDLLNLQDEMIDLNFSYDKDIVLDSRYWDLYLNFGDGLNLQTSKLSNFKKYSPLMHFFNIQGADNFSLRTKDFKAFYIDLEKLQFDFGLTSKDSKDYKNDDFTIVKTENSFTLKTKSNLLNLDFKGNHKNIKIQDLSLVYDKKFKESNATNLQSIYNIQALNSGVILKDKDTRKVLFFDELNATIDKGNVKASAKRFGAKYDFSKKDQNMSVKLSNLSDENINEFFDKSIFKNGNFNLTIQGRDFDDFEGKFFLKNTYAKDLKFHNQLVSFIDAVPSLLTFKSPTFNEKGLNIDKGVVLFEKKGKYLNLDALQLDGDSTDILGNGRINFAIDEIDLNLELKTLKSASQVIDYIPIINQVILGKDREISTRIRVDGSLNDPKFHTQIFKDTLKLPFNIIKNIVEMPATWFE